MLSFLPDWFWTLLLISGLVSFGLSLINTLYKLPLKAGGIVAIIISVWFLGAASNEAKWDARVKELEQQLEVANEKSKDKNVEIQEKVVTQTKVIKEKGKDIIKYIDREIVKKEEIIKYVERCPVPKEIVDAHNAAAMLNKAAENKK